MSDRPRLTEREQQTLRGAAQGKTNAEIAAELSRSVETVRTHAKSVIRKLGARDRPHAVHLGHVHGYLTTEEPNMVDETHDETVEAAPMLAGDRTASERPNAGQDEGCGADGCTSFGGCGVCEQEAAQEAAPREPASGDDTWAVHAIISGYLGERPNAGQETTHDRDALEDLRVTYSIDTDTIFVYDPVCSWWEEFERSGGEVDTVRLPADIGPLWEGQPDYNDRARADAATRRADAAETKLRFTNDRIKGLETSTAEAWLNHGVALSERKAAEAKLDEIRAVLADPKYGRPKSGREVHRNESEKLVRIRAIVERNVMEGDRGAGVPDAAAEERENQPVSNAARAESHFNETDTEAGEHAVGCPPGDQAATTEHEETGQ